MLWDLDLAQQELENSDPVLGHWSSLYIKVWTGEASFVCCVFRPPFSEEEILDHLAHDLWILVRTVPEQPSAGRGRSSRDMPDVCKNDPARLCMRSA